MKFFSNYNLIPRRIFSVGHWLSSCLALLHAWAQIGVKIAVLIMLKDILSHKKLKADLSKKIYQVKENAWRMFFSMAILWLLHSKMNILPMRYAWLIIKHVNCRTQKTQFIEYVISHNKEIRQLCPPLHLPFSPKKRMPQIVT